MADDALFDFLHMEIVSHVTKSDPGLLQDGDEAMSKLEQIGYSTGYRFIERLTKDLSRFKDELEVMKAICKDFWSAVFKKQVDNLRTNHQGVYVLQDNKFRFLASISNSRQYLELAPKYLVFTCGLLRGALASLGLTCIVTAEVTTMPACKFQVHLQRA
ncbi:trafficking protein particle complex subunit 6b [Daphnia magna]|uniref:Trafficking protein particle complex subunit 6B n=1 Tax=Daphnia magna TaxID=35525 RepID=A0A0N8E773_9CRUS|nr:trafficking protein particle complex subunit 6b [Daphnia magna]